MVITDIGIAIYSEEDLIDKLKIDPELNLSNVLCDSAINHNKKIDQYFLELPYLQDSSIIDAWNNEFHKDCQSRWKMPNEYKEMDIVQFLIDSCTNDDELERIGKELLLYQSLDLFDLLRYCKYFIDVVRKNNIVMGVGRGSSVASFVLYKLGIHKINSLQYNLDITEFLK